MSAVVIRLRLVRSLVLESIVACDRGAAEALAKGWLDVAEVESQRAASWRSEVERLDAEIAAAVRS